jgi:rfaE bifunctional protein nucleotidyltransferase chain/domain
MNPKGLIKRAECESILRRLKARGNKLVFTNGVFDVLHRGHVDYLAKAAACGDILVVGLNSDASVRRLKGPDRPIQRQSDRAAILLALRVVDYVVIFGEDTPVKLIRQVKPDVLAKGADYRITEIVGADFVRSYGGKVRRIRLTPGRSSSKIISGL